MTASASASHPADRFIDYRPEGATLTGVDDSRPYAVDLAADGPGDVRTYRFADVWAARGFVVDEGLVAA